MKKIFAISMVLTLVMTAVTAFAATTYTSVVYANNPDVDPSVSNPITANGFDTSFTPRAYYFSESVKNDGTISKGNVELYMLGTISKTYTLHCPAFNVFHTYCQYTQKTPVRVIIDGKIDNCYNFGYGRVYCSGKGSMINPNGKLTILTSIRFDVQDGKVNIVGDTATSTEYFRLTGLTVTHFEFY